MSLLKPEIRELLMKAIGEELFANSLYKSLANQLQAVGYFGAQSYFLKESEQELGHYQILVDYFNDRGDVADMPQVEAITDRATSLKAAFNLSYHAEKNLEDFYVDFYEKAEDEMEDCVTAQFLLQFIQIQRESVGEVKDILSMLAIAGNDAGALLLIDKKLGE